jgi:3-isopropylmalate/(R)-2-methylmalate dehydratase small subunit
MTGRAFVFGDDIDTDLLAPGRFMKLPAPELARHCLEDLDLHFASAVRPGDFLVAGRNFGLGSSREQAVVSLKLLGIAGVLALSFGRIFHRNAINLGLPAVVFGDAATVRGGDRLLVDFAAGRVENLSQGTLHEAQALPQHLLMLLRDGGLMPHIKKCLMTETRSDGDRNWQKRPLNP